MQFKRSSPLAPAPLSSRESLGEGPICQFSALGREQPYVRILKGWQDTGQSGFSIEVTSNEWE